MSLHMLAFSGVTPIGSLLVGALIEALGVPAGISGAGAAGVLFVLVLLAWRGRHPTQEPARR